MIYYNFVVFCLTVGRFLLAVLIRLDPNIWKCTLSVAVVFTLSVLVCSMLFLVLGAWSRPILRRQPLHPDSNMPKFALDFEVITNGLPDELMESWFADLLQGAHELAAEFLATENLPYFNLAKFTMSISPELLDYINKVAWSDVDLASWNRLFSDQLERTYIVQAVLVKTLHSRVISDLLFGASKDHKQILERLDISQQELEGFERTKIRSVTNLAYLRSCGASEIEHADPPHFWEEVDIVTTSILSMLLPLYELDHVPDTGREQAPLLVIYQKLHQLVVQAAYMNTALRCSPDIVEFSWLDPGERHGRNQVSCSPAIYEQTVARARMASRRGRDTEPPQARVMIAVAPGIKRHTLDPIPLPLKGSTRVYELQQPHAVYFAGSLLEEEHDGARVPFSKPSIPFYLALYLARLLILAAFLLLVFVVSVPSPLHNPQTVLERTNAYLDPWRWCRRCFFAF